MFIANSRLASISVHPALRLLLWLAYALCLQWAEGVGLLLLLGMAGASLLVSGVGGRWCRTMWRLRWLLLSLSLIFAWSTPGELLWSMEWAPTYEGLAAALNHGARLLALLLAVVYLASTTSQAALMSGLYYLLSPMRHLGLPPDRVVARLLLTLEYVDALPKRSGWRGFIEATQEQNALVDEGGARTVLSLVLPAFSKFDYVLATMLVIGVVLRVLGGYGC